MPGEFMRTLDSITAQVKAILFVLFLALWFILVAGPYLLYRNAVDWLTRSTHQSTIWIVELNSAIAPHGEDSLLDPPFPAVSGIGTGAPAPWYYATTHSIKEAENWLLAHGYKKSVIGTNERGRYGSKDPALQKTFFTRRIDGTKGFSVVGLLVDYGDHDVHIIPLTESTDKPLVNFGRFQIGPHHMMPDYPEPPLNWQSSDRIGSHTLGRVRSNRNEIEQYDADYGKCVGAHWETKLNGRQYYAYLATH